MFVVWFCEHHKHKNVLCTPDLSQKYDCEENAVVYSVLHCKHVSYTSLFLQPRFRLRLPFYVPYPKLTQAGDPFCDVTDSCEYDVVSFTVFLLTTLLPLVSANNCLTGNGWRPFRDGCAWTDDSPRIEENARVASLAMKATFMYFDSWEEVYEFRSRFPNASECEFQIEAAFLVLDLHKKSRYPPGNHHVICL